MATDKRKLPTTNTTALAALSQTPYQNNRGTSFATMGIRWDQYLEMRETGQIVERQRNGSAPDVAITPLGIAAQTWM